MMLEINIPEVLAEVTEAFLRYERALVANDIPALDGLVWVSPHTVRYGIAENQYGSEAIAKFRRTRPPIDLARDLQNTAITTFGRDFAIANTEFRGRGAPASGRQSQVWVRTGAGWQIVAAHVSLVAE
jgi:ketosteroid isomerase-like protein